jgi:hypothetical protein
MGVSRPRGGGRLTTLRKQALGIFNAMEPYGNGFFDRDGASSGTAVPTSRAHSLFKIAKVLTGRKQTSYRFAICLTQYKTPDINRPTTTTKGRREERPKFIGSLRR